MSLVLQLLNCNACGGPLDVAPKANFVSCGHCGSRLAIHRTGTAVFTEVLERIESKVDLTARRVAEIAYRDQIEQVDREWEDTRKRFLGPDADGEPDLDFDRSVQTIMIVAGGLSCLIGLLLGLLLSHTKDFERSGLLVILPFEVIGVALMSIGWWRLNYRVSAGETFLTMRTAYMKRRSAIKVEHFLPVPATTKPAN